MGSSTELSAGKAPDGYLCDLGTPGPWFSHLRNGSFEGTTTGSTAAC